MKPFRKKDEGLLLKGLKRIFENIIKRVSAGNITPEEMQDIGRKFIASPEADRSIRRLIARMFRNIRVYTAGSWQEAATKGGYGQVIHNALKHEMDGPVGARIWQMISENAAYIKTIPQEWARYISEYIARETLKGLRPEQIEEELQKVMPAHMTKNLKCIARTEAAKANAAITEARAEACGIKCYFWRCVKDERSRDSHIGMDGVLVFYNDPPNPEALFGGGKPYGNYHAGNTFNCRCYQEPVVDLNWLPDTMKVHVHGSIVTMTRAEVIKMAA